MGDRGYKANSRVIGPHGGYRNLKSYQTAEIIHDATVVFCERFMSRHSRTNDQMIQAARSGKQNIAEVSVSSGTSKKSELKLLGVARASLALEQAEKMGGCEKNHSKCLEISVLWVLKRSVEHLSRRHFE